MSNKVNPLRFSKGHPWSRTEKWAHILTFVTFVSVISFNVYAADPHFGNRVDLGLIEYDPIREASGIAASQKESKRPVDP